MYKPYFIIGSTVLALSFFSQTVTAQGQEKFVVEEVIVTANKREQSLQEVPMSVSAFDSDFIKNTGANSLGDLENYTPSLKIQTGTDSRSTSIRIRGIGSVGTNSGIDPSVGLFIDGVYQGRAGMSISDLIDIERIEVLRGPQGSLYGKNTAAGAISVVTKKPAPEFEAEVEAVYNSDHQGELRGMVNVPFGSNGNAMRLTGFGILGKDKQYNTFTREGVNDAKKAGFKSRFLFNLEESGEFLVTVDYSKENTNCCALAIISYDGLSTLNAPLTRAESARYQATLPPGQMTFGENGSEAFENTETDVGSPPTANPFNDDRWFNTPFYNDVTVGGIATEWNYDMDNDNTITFINAWRNYTSDSQIDGDFTAYNAVVGRTDVELDQFSSELRITSPGSETWDYQGGLYAYYSELDSLGQFEMQEALIRNAGFAGTFPDLESLNTDTNTYKTTSYAAFGQIAWNPSEKASLTLGMRYTYEKKDREGSQVSDPEIVDDIPPIAGPDIEMDDNRTDSSFSPSLNLRYFWSEDLMTYGSVSRGFKSGGYDQRRLETCSTTAFENNACPEPQSSYSYDAVNDAYYEKGEFEKEIATNYELGWKATWFDRRLTVNGTFFLVQYDDFQSQSFNGSSLKVTNAGSLESYGTELEVVFIPNANTIMGTAIGFNKAEYDEFDGGQCTVDQSFFVNYVVAGSNLAPGTSGVPCSQDLAGEVLDNAPELTVSSYFQYEYAVQDDLMLTSRIEHNYIDSFFLDQDLDPNLFNEAVDLINLRFTLSNASRDWEVAVWGQNILDEEYFAVGLDIPTVGGYAGSVAPGETYGLTVRYSFY